MRKMESTTKQLSNKEEPVDLEIQKLATGAAEMVATFDPVVTRSLKRKADFILLPILAVAYLFKYET
jgi:hypothetical protein